ncbi:MAG: hypothetical protein E4H40_02965 [Candidatus Brocadiia bacterium]|nr:MAG: hypothetical protein E4H40_02965 [Candidatus Brocadiia bacterium]
MKTEHGEGRVIDGQILTQLVLVEHTDGRKIAYGLENIEIEGQARPINRPNETNIPNEIENAEDTEENGSEDQDQ